MHENFKRILVTTDFSEAGDHAIGHAFRMAADHGAEVVLCHVVETIIAPNPLYAHYYPADLLNPEIRMRAEQDAHSALIERVPKEAPLIDVPHSSLVAHGTPADEIIRAAKDRDANRRIRGQRGGRARHGFPHADRERVSPLGMIEDDPAERGLLHHVDLAGHGRGA